MISELSPPTQKPNSIPPRTRPHPGLLRFFAVLLVLGMIGAAAWGIIQRNTALADLAKVTEARAVTNVVLTKAIQGPLAEDLVLPGSVQANLDAPIYARTSGYLKAWYSDIGAVVKKDQLLALIETPEIDAQRNQAEADLATAEANLQLAESTARRYKALVATDSVPRQENEDKQGDAAAKTAIVASARANLARLDQLSAFKRVTAPFDGVVTARKTDIGALINAGSGSGPELFHLSDTARLRVFLQVPELYAPRITLGMIAKLHFSEYPGREFPASVVRTAGAMDPAARTLLVELQIDNSQHELLPGGYTEVHLTIPGRSNSVRLPINTLLFRADGLHIATLTDDNHVKLVSVTLGRDYGTEIEVLTGISPNQQIVLNPPDSLVDGEAVRVVTGTVAP